MSASVVPKEAVAKAARKRSRRSRNKAKTDTPEASSSKPTETKASAGSFNTDKRAKSILDQISTSQHQKNASKTPPSTAKQPVPKDLNNNSKGKGKVNAHSTQKHNSNFSSKTSWLLKSTGATLHTLTPSSLLPSPTPVTSSTPTTLLCSYNWLSSSSAILVPGGPPRWTPPSLPHTIPPDSGQTFIDQNASRVPAYPFEPAFRAMAAMNPDMQLHDIDVVLNRNSLRKLLDFAAGKRADPWRMGLCMVGNTLFITRNEKRASMMVHAKSGAGYGHGFERAFTTPGTGLEGSSSHHRVVRYMLGGLDVAVRFEVDAYIGDEDGEKEGKEGGDEEAVLRDIADAMERTSINATTTAPDVTGSSTTPTPVATSANPSSTLTQPTTQNQKGKAETPVQPAGSTVLPHTLAELKTASQFKPAKLFTPQLWFGRTSHLLTGIHSNGKFHQVQTVDVGARFASWENTDIMQDRLRKMVGVLEVLRGVVGGLEGKGRREAVLVLEERGGDVRVLESTSQNGVMPPDLLAQFWGEKGNGQVSE